MQNQVNYEDRIQVFNQLSTEESTNSLKEDVFSGLLDEFYDKFTETCEYVKENKNKIEHIAGFMKDGKLIIAIKEK